MHVHSRFTGSTHLSHPHSTRSLSSTLPCLDLDRRHHVTRITLSTNHRKVCFRCGMGWCWWTVLSVCLCFLTFIPAYPSQSRHAHDSSKGYGTQIPLYRASDLPSLESQTQGVYEGERNAEGGREGKGIYTWPNGERYEGDFVNDVREGFGVLTWPDGRRYEGEYRANRREGQGKIEYPSGESYEGEFLKDKKQGFGIHILPSGEKYEGEFVEDMRHGEGVLFLPDEMGLVNAFSESVMADYGVHNNNNDKGSKSRKEKNKHRSARDDVAAADESEAGQRKDGRVYRGSFVKNTPHGHGVMEWSTGQKYEGEYHEGFPDGYGQLWWSSGETYEGEFVKGRPSGSGVHKLADGLEFRGEFYAGGRYGRGVMTWPDGKQRDCEWRDGHFFDLGPRGSHDEASYEMSTQTGVLLTALLASVLFLVFAGDEKARKKKESPKSTPPANPPKNNNNRRGGGRKRYGG